jgi:hypothetical protein
MISTEIYIEDYKLDLLQDISTEFTYAIDDITDFGTKNTSFSKTISLSGTARNNQIFGFVFDMGNANFTDDTLPNVNYNFNASKSAQCKIFIDKVQIFKGTLRILEIVIDGKTIEYQCSVFGELGGFINALGNARLEDLDFSAYDHTYNVAAISASWDSATGSGYYYPLIDYGNVSTGVYGTAKVDFQYSTFRPAFYIKEYIDKIFAATDYTYDSDFFNTALFKRLVIPHNQKTLTSSSNIQLAAIPTNKTYTGSSSSFNIEYFTTTLGSFTLTSNYLFTYTAAATKVVNINLNLTAVYAIGNTGTINIRKNSISIGSYYVGSAFSGHYFTASLALTAISLSTNDTLTVTFNMSPNGSYQLQVLNGSLNVTTTSSELVPINYNEALKVNNTLPKGIFQRDLILSIAKMFNLYIYDDVYDDKKIHIKPYIDFYADKSDNALDWSNKIDRAKALSIKPMSELNARYYHYKFKEDTDFYNDNYKKKYNENYGDRIYDTAYDFSKNTESVEVIFAPSVLFQGTGTDKKYAAIYKKSNNNTTEDIMDSVVRIMQVKKITGATSWTIKNGATTLATYTSYGYAGHLDDPNTPTNDINFGAPKELQISVTSYPTRNVFNAYHSEYIAEITDKNSKLLTCYALLNTVDILNLDFSKYIWIDGVLFRLNKIDGFNPMEYNTTKISLLKVIETIY